MAKLQTNGRNLEVEVAVFDKDGLLFDSQHFWKHLAEARLRELSRLLEPEALCEWAEWFGVRQTDGEIDGADPNGILALASPQEEIAITASLLKRHGIGDWGRCRRAAADAFDRSDRDFSLYEALLPKRGFPAVFDRLREAGVTIGIATSDDRSRAIDSVARYARADDLAFIVTPADVRRGKPYPDMLELIAERTGARRERIAMIGDSFVDVQMASEAGCIGIGIPDDPEMREKMRPFGAEIVDSLDDILVVGG
ncbi:HAD-IA family hydrolase [Cohnella thailandensis]|uniref:HAD family hydrolase n=1 Tax=Cohnella thailandensis TaxID=557557 RepID=A0A841T159_9BACL|nr:HAD family hydrolase [Cohnella thailandensis]MBP1973736.1 phosphoglycolate phosphatase [Cohnella thailandensis]